MTADAARAYVRLLEELKADSLDILAERLAPNARFADPIHDVTGRTEVLEVFGRMFDTVADLKFTVGDWAITGGKLLMVWRFEGTVPAFGDRPWTVDGMSTVEFDESGQVLSHIDYWDAGRLVHERLPVWGALVSRVRRRLARRPG